MLNPQNARNYDAIQVINPPIFLIVLKFFSWSPNLNLLSIPYILHPLALGKIILLMEDNNNTTPICQGLFYTVKDYFIHTEEKTLFEDGTYCFKWS